LNGFNSNFNPETNSVEEGWEWLLLVCEDVGKKGEVKVGDWDMTSKPVNEEKVTVPEKVKPVIELTDAQKDVVNHSSLNKSEKMRRLWRTGLLVKQIYRILNVDYVFVYDVIKRYEEIINQSKK